MILKIEKKNLEVFFFCYKKIDFLKHMFKNSFLKQLN